ncbi:hypothetical protein ABXV24_04085 [Vibrio owensii]|uniref:hypothetical protein n=1 Tax=Vibrio owensii TaxID=696485 RepID=UPI00339199A1
MYIFRIIVWIFILTSSGFANASWNVVPDQVFNINAKYDQYKKEFYDLVLTGPEGGSVQILSNNEILINHGRNGFVNRTVSNRTRVQYIRNTYLEPRFITMIGSKSRQEIKIDVGLRTTQHYGPALQQNFGGGNMVNGCNITYPNGLQPFFQFWMNGNLTGDLYSGNNCQSIVFDTFSATFPNSARGVGFVERIFKFDENKLNTVTFDKYQVTYRTNPRSDYLYDVNTGSGHEVYQYNISIDIVSNINSIDVESSNLVFSVSKANGLVKGYAQTGFKVDGAFHNSQAFDISFTSLNSSQCQGEFCLRNSDSNKTIKYKVNVLDPGTLTSLDFYKNNEKKTIYSDNIQNLNGTLKFEFQSNDSSLSGNFTDVISMLVAIKI